MHVDGRPAPVLGPRLRRRLAALGRVVAAAGRSLAAAPLTVQRILTVVTGSMVAGALLGAVAAHAHDGAARWAQRGVLAVDATAPDLTVSGRDTLTIETTARVTNHGPTPIQVVTGTSRTGLVVAPTGTAGTTVPAGARGSVRATLVVDCQAATLVPMPLLQVRTADGRHHDVPLEVGAFGSTPLREAVCQGSQAQSVAAAVTGPLERPVLRLTNTGAHTSGSR